MNYQQFYFRCLAVSRVVTYCVRIGDDMEVDFKVVSDVPLSLSRKARLLPTRA